MHDPFKIDSPTCISFSGGRTSAYMLWRVLQSNDGLPPEAVVCFANTGKEDPATLDFVDRCSRVWHVAITWVEYRADAPGYAVVDYASASRIGEPFHQCIVKNRYLPNPVTRFCTVRLKIRTMHKHLRSLGWFDGDGWDQMVGIRADEQRRVAKIRARPSPETMKETMILPLADAGVTAGQVGSFWRAQPFDLELPNIGGRTMHGNCDLCFLKPAAQIQALIAEKPERAVWWIDQETYAKSIQRDAESMGIRFRWDRPSYGQMARFVAEQRDMFDPNEEAIACFCGD